MTREIALPIYPTNPEIDRPTTATADVLTTIKPRSIALATTNHRDQDPTFGSTRRAKRPAAGGMARIAIKAVPKGQGRDRGRGGMIGVMMRTERGIRIGLVDQSGTGVVRGIMMGRLGAGLAWEVKAGREMGADIGATGAPIPPTLAMVLTDRSGRIRARIEAAIKAYRRRMRMRTRMSMAPTGEKQIDLITIRLEYLPRQSTN